MPAEATQREGWWVLELNSEGCGRLLKPALTQTRVTEVARGRQSLREEADEERHGDLRSRQCRSATSHSQIRARHHTPQSSSRTRGSTRQGYVDKFP